MTNIKSIPNYASTVAGSSFSLFKHADYSQKAITIADFVMQVQPNWIFYLVYTAGRCAYLTYQYKQTPDVAHRQQIWQQAQVYASTKTLGLIVSQVILSALALTTPASVALILTWGAVLFSMSAYAHYRANKSEEQQSTIAAPSATNA